eukprot:GHVQ01000006.1.p1 GENE.GHVQ01000006.1~~GHVQ01000006.1.p1  ORF type:complete len:444 (+),score=36.25 GHVQ01000006.1:175-1506(+)
MEKAGIFCLCILVAVLSCFSVHGVPMRQVDIRTNTPVRQTLDPVYTCPEGYNQDGKECGKVVRSGPVESCPTGSVMTSAGCTVIRPVVLSCEEGFTKECGKHHSSKCTCTQTIVEDKVRDACPVGTIDSVDFQYCSKTQLAPIVEKCPEGSSQNWHSSWKHGVSANALECYVDEFLAPECSCSKGEPTTEGNKCVLEEVYDCTPESHTVPSFHSRHLLAKKKLKAGQHLHGGNQGTHVHEDGTSKAGHFTKEVLSRTCKRTKVLNPTCECPDGTTKTGMGNVFGKYAMKCRARTTVAPEKRCSIDLSPVNDDEDCFQTKKVMPTYSCAEGFVNSCERNWLHHSEQCKCVQINSGDVLTSCAEGFTEANGKCIKLVDSDFSCERGSTRAGDMCESIRIVQPTVTYTTTYSCIGKGCGAMDNHHAKKLKAKVHGGHGGSLHYVGH